MPKRKVIEDSDDESAFESPTKEAKTSHDGATGETYETIAEEPVKLRLNDEGDNDDLREQWNAQRDAGRKISLSQPNAPATSKSPARKSRRAKTLTDIDVSETSSASIESSKRMKSFDSNDIFEFRGEVEEEGDGPKKKRGRMQSQDEKRVAQKSLQTPEYLPKIQYDATQTSTIPTIADTSSFQVPSMSSYLNDEKNETVPNDQATAPQDMMTTNEALKDSFEDELALAYPMKASRASTKPMVLVPEHHAEHEATMDGNSQHDDRVAHKSKKSKKTVDSEEDPHDLAEELGSDDQHIGIPKDQYKPRPSRSRGRGRNSDQELMVPTDFSKRPEAVSKVKMKNKRAKSADHDDAEVMIEAETVNADELQEEMSLQSDARHVDEEAKTNEPPVEAMAEDVYDIQTSAKPAKKPRGRPKKNPEIVHREDGAQEDEHADTDDVFHASKPVKGAKKEVKSKKSSSIVDDDSDCSDVESESKVDDRLEETKEVQTQPLQEVDANSPRKRGRPAKMQEIVSPNPETTDVKPAAASPKELKRYSPVNKSGAVKYRVGLSKRARIEPLLRIVRK